MLNFAETMSSRTIVPMMFVSDSSSQEHTVVLPYTIGPLDPAQVITMQALLSTGGACSLLLPVHVPRHILDDPAFRNGYEYNYLTEEYADEEEEWTALVTRLVNHIYSSLTNTRVFRNLDTHEVDAGFLPHQVGWLLRDLTRLARTDHTLASVGMKHLCFLLPLLMQNRPANWPYSEPCRTDILHTQALRDYRAQVSFYREQGKSYDEAQRLALY